MIDGDGYPVVSGTVYPMPRIDLSDRDYFRVHKNNEVAGLHISEVLDARAANLSFFAVSRKREINGRFAGVTIVSIAPEYFSEYYARLPADQQDSASLLRADGVVLARYPPSAERHHQGCRRMARSCATMREHPDMGRFVSRSPFDNIERTFAYRKLPRHDVYVATSFDDRHRGARPGSRTMGSHLIFGFRRRLRCSASA